MERKCGKCWKLSIFEGKLQVFLSYLRGMKTVSSITLPCSSTFYSLFLPFFVLEIFKFKYDKFFIKHSASISKFEWQELPWYGAWKTQLFVILDYFLHFHPPNNLKYQNFEKMKKPPGDIITLHMCTINDNPMMYGSWNMERDGHNFLSFWIIFCPFAP